MTSHSQAGQDLFAFAMTEGKTDGFFLDIGCNDAKVHSNTYALERLGWTGLMVDIAEGCESRKGTFVKSDAANPTPELRAAYDQMPSVVDFLSLDVDAALIGVFNQIPWTHSYRVSCIEHDSYLRGNYWRDIIRLRMKGMGYELTCANVGVRYPDLNGPVNAYEDWFTYPPLVNESLRNQYRCFGVEGKTIARVT